MVDKNKAYFVEVMETSKGTGTNGLTKRDAVRLKDAGNTVKIQNTVTVDSPLVIKPVFYAITHTYNANANTDAGQNAEYETLIIESEDGERYSSGSASLRSSFLNIWGEMADDNGNPSEDYEVEIRRIPSANRNGQTFLKAFLL